MFRREDIKIYLYTSRNTVLFFGGLKNLSDIHKVKYIPQNLCHCKCVKIRVSRTWGNYCYLRVERTFVN